MPDLDLLPLVWMLAGVGIYGILRALGGLLARTYGYLIERRRDQQYGYYLEAATEYTAATQEIQGQNAELRDILHRLVQDWRQISRVDPSGHCLFCGVPQFDQDPSSGVLTHEVNCPLWRAQTYLEAAHVPAN